MESGLERAERSSSSAQGRRLERPLWTVSVMLEMNARKAVGGAAAAVESVVVWLEMGRTCGDEEDMMMDLVRGVFVCCEM